MAKYDAENLIADIKALMVSKLNSSITAVELEKIAQGLPDLSLEPVDSTNGYFENGWGSQNQNINPAVVYGFEEIPAEGIGPTTRLEYKVFIFISLVNTQVDDRITSRIHRYTRALRDVFEQNYDALPSRSRILIKTVLPMAFRNDENSSEPVFIGGVILTIPMA